MLPSSGGVNVFVCLFVCVLRSDLSANPGELFRVPAHNVLQLQQSVRQRRDGALHRRLPTSSSICDAVVEFSNFFEGCVEGTAHLADQLNKKMNNPSEVKSDQKMNQSRGQ